MRVNRTFTRIDAPDVGEYVFAVTLRNDGPDGPIDMAEFQVWTLEIDASRNAVKMAPQRYKTPEAYVDISTNADAMAQLCRSIFERWGAVDVWAHTAIEAMQQAGQFYLRRMKKSTGIPARSPISIASRTAPTKPTPSSRMWLA